MKSVIEPMKNTGAMNWNDKRTHVSTCDITVSVIGGKKRPRVSLIFRNDSDKIISPDGCIQICAEGNRIYFRNADSRIGYKVSRKGDGITNGYIVFDSTNVLPLFEQLIGDYELIYDATNKLYFVEKQQ